MKKILLVLVSVMAINLYAQEPLSFSEVVQVEGISKGELYNRAKIWFAEVYKDAKEVIQVDDKESGKIIGKGTEPFTQSFMTSSAITKGGISYIIKVFLKDGRYKYEITDFTHSAHGGNFGKYSLGLLTSQEDCPTPKKMAKKWSNKVWKDAKEQSEAFARVLIESLKENMSKQSAEEDDNW